MKKIDPIVVGGTRFHFIEIPKRRTMTGEVVTFRRTQNQLEFWPGLSLTRIAELAAGFASIYTTEGLTDYEIDELPLGISVARTVYPVRLTNRSVGSVWRHHHQDDDGTYWFDRRQDREELLNAVVTAAVHAVQAWANEIIRNTYSQAKPSKRQWWSPGGAALKMPTEGAMPAEMKGASNEQAS